MADLMTALGLALAIEGMAYALFPDGMRKMIAQVMEQPNSVIRSAGVVAAGAGVVIVWLVRG